MKIVHIITRLIVGGAQENTLLSCEGQHARGHEVTLITGPALGPEGSLMERAKAFGYQVIELDSMRRAIGVTKDPKSYVELVQLLRKIRPDVVHTHSSKAGIVGRWAAWHARVPVIIHTIHGLAFTASTNRAVNTFYRLAEKVTAPISTRIVCVADAMAEQSLAGGVGKRPQYITIYSGMETAPFLHPPVSPEQVRKSLGIAPEHVIVGTVARLFELKGHDDLIDIAPDLCAKYPQLRFMWVGDGNLRERFGRQIRQMHLTDRFIMTGLVPPARIPELMGAMDIVVHPSRREGLARALAQGSLAGKPVVTYDIDGNREALRPGITGFLIKPFEVIGLRHSLEQLLSDATRRTNMGMAGREFVLQRFDAQRMVDSLEKLYAQCLAK